MFTAAGLGHAAGWLYTHLGGSTLTTDDLHTATGIPVKLMGALLADLLAARLIVRTGAGWRHASRDRRTQAARRLRCEGILRGRRKGYHRERVLWGWWCDELDWMRLPRTDPAKRRRPGRVAAGQLTIDGAPARGRYPRRGDGRTDHRRAAALTA